MATSRYLVLSDMHFGTSESSVNQPTYMNALTDHIVGQRHYDEIIFTGDLLDTNLSTLTRAIEGRRGDDPLFGFRDFLVALHTKAGPAGFVDLADRWVYVPGNHDYRVWDVLASKLVCEDVLASGDPLDPSRMPLRHHRWFGDQSFFAGLFRPFGVEQRILVEYPNHLVRFDAERTMVFSHGHYLDRSQTRGNDLSACLGGDLTPKEIEEVARDIFIETAQYQAIASAVSYTARTRSLINELVGPGGLMDKLQRLLTAITRWLARLSFRSKGRLRDKAISPKQLANIDTYCERFCGLAPIPKWFIFGHTHRQGKAKTPRLGIEAYNVGSCYPDAGMPITFIEVEVVDGTPVVHRMGVNGQGAIQAH